MPGLQAEGDPFGYVTPLDSTARVVYLGGGGHIHELRLPPGGAWADADLSSLVNGAPTAEGDPFGYVTPLDNIARVVYFGADRHIHELSLPPGGGWADADLSSVGHAATDAASDPRAYVISLDNVPRVIYLGADNHVHELRLPPGENWIDADLYISGHSTTNAAGDPFGYVTPLDSIARVIYRGADNNIHELSLPPGGGWADADLSSVGHAATDAASDPRAYVISLDNVPRVIYLGADNHVHELRLPPGENWIDADLYISGHSTTNAAGDPFGYVTPLDSIARVIYRGADNHIHELSLPPGGGWADADLSSLGHATIDAAGDPRAYVISLDNVPRVIYLGADNHIHELRLPPGGSWIDADLTELLNPALSRNSTGSAFHAAFLKTTNSVLVAAMR